MNKADYLYAGIPIALRALVTDKRHIIEGILQSERGLFLSGGTGTGKTVLLASIARAIIDQGFHRAAAIPDYMFVSFPWLVLELQADYEHAMSVLRRHSKTEFLFLDDIGAEKTTDFVKQCFYALLDAREKNNKKTYITSNLTLDQIATIYDQRISSRIGGNCEIVYTSGADMRLKGGGRNAATR